MIGRDVSFSGCRPNIDTVPTLMQSHPRVAFRKPLSSDSGLPLPRTLAAVSMSAGHLAEMICSRAGFILPGIIKMIAYRNVCCKRTPIC
jgi:hypothetical protein